MQVGEDLLKNSVELLVRLVEGAGALVIFVGAALAFVGFGNAALRYRHEPHRFVSVRLGLGRYLALGLEFQLASDVLRTAVAPTLREIGELAAVAAIRTALNFFLAREIQEEQRQLGDPPDGARRAAPTGTAGTGTTGTGTTGTGTAGTGTTGTGTTGTGTTGTGSTLQP